jgi:hypothetical protein
MGTGSFPGVKRPGRGADHPSPSSAEVKKEYSYTSTHPLGHFRPATGQLYLTIEMRIMCLIVYVLVIRISPSTTTQLLSYLFYYHSMLMVLDKGVCMVEAFISPVLVVPQYSV